MKLKRTVKYAMIVSCAIIACLLIIGIFVPESLLRESDSTTVVSYQGDDKVELRLQEGGTSDIESSEPNSSAVDSGLENPAQDSTQANETTNSREESPVPASTSSSGQSNTNQDNSGTQNPAPQAVCGQSGGVCTLADINSFNSAGNCRAAINATGSGVAAYAIPSSFLSLHQSEKSITKMLCGNVYDGNLQSAEGKHRNGSSLGGSNYATWIANFYLGPYAP